jgi:DNA adenine methylase
MGSKAKLAKTIVELFPETFNTYYEPFFGSGAVFFELQPENAYCSDLMSEPIVVMNAIKNSPEKMYDKFKMLADELWEEGEVFYYAVREVYNEKKGSMDDVTRAAYFMFLLRSAFNGVIRFNSKKNNAWNVPFGKRGSKFTKNTKLYNDKFLTEVMQHSEFLRSGSKLFEVGSFEIAIDKAAKDDIVYADPPYTKTSSKKRYNMGWGIEDDERLRDSLVAAFSRGANFVLSNIIEYKGESNDYILELYKNFEYKYINHQYIVGPKAKTRQKVKEVLIFSTPLYN